MERHEVDIKYTWDLSKFYKSDAEWYSDFKKLKTYKAINVVLDCTDTLITTKNNIFCDKTLNRNNIKRVQTPQAFELNTIKKAHELLKSSTLSINVTDDCGLVNYFNLAEVFLVKGDENNIKII